MESYRQVGIDGNLEDTRQICTVANIVTSRQNIIERLTDIDTDKIWKVKFFNHCYKNEYHRASKFFRVLEGCNDIYYYRITEER